MTDQERQLLQELADRIQKAPASQVDRDADDLIRRSIGARPDALYILTQTVLIQEMALNQAKQQLEELKRQQPSASFLGNTPPPQQQPASGYRASTYQTGYVPPAPAAPAPAPPPLPAYATQQQYGAPQPSGISGFLHNAAQTAAGIVAGEVAFSAISSLFGSHGGGYFGGTGFLGGGGGGFVSPMSETIINNNYYDEDRGGDRGDRGERQVASDTDAGDYIRDDSKDSFAGDTLADVDDTTADDSSSYDSGSDSTDV